MPVQRELYRTAYDQLYHNMDILKPGVSFREYAQKAWEVPPRFFDNCYCLSAQGVYRSRPTD